MSPRLALRIAFAGGRAGLARAGLMAIGVAIGVTLILLSLVAMPAVQGRIDRYAWHRTDASSPAAAPDAAIWHAVTDRYAGRNLIRVHIAALGPRPPVPPGVDRLPGPGEVLVSPALAQLLPTVPDDQLRDRLPGRITGTIGPEGLVSPVELVAIVGHHPDELRSRVGTTVIQGFERPGDAVDLGVFIQVMITIVAVLLVGPVVVFVALVTRVGAARREQRLAALRLAGATRWQTGVVASTETALAAGGGALLGWAAFRLLRPVVAANATLEGMPFPVEDLVVPPGQVVTVLVGVTLVAVVTTLVALYRVQITPLGVRQKARRRRPRAWRLLPIAGGVLAIAAAIEQEDPTASQADPVVSLLAVVGPLSILVGIVLSGPLVCMWVSRGLARLIGRPVALIAARRIAADPYAASHAVIGVALAVFVGTLIGAGPGTDPAARVAEPSGLAPGVVAIDVGGAGEQQVAALMTEDTVVAGGDTGRGLVVACADIARVTRLTCDTIDDSNDDGGFRPLGLPVLVVEPKPGEASGRAQMLFVPTDGTVAAEERVRTAAAVAVPDAVVRSHRDYVPGPGHQPFDAETPESFFDGIGSAFWLAMLFVVLVAACSMTVSTVAALMDRRRPFALLRASGVRLRQLRLIALMETGIPLAFTALAGFVAALLVEYAIAPDEFGPPDAGLVLVLALGLFVALAVSLVTWPLLDAVTRHDQVRFE
jgi:hypothetical protein